MDSQGRSRLIIGALSLAAVILVISLLLTQQRSQLPAAAESPLTNNSTATQSANTEIPTADKGVAVAAAALPTEDPQAVSPLAAPAPDSPLPIPNNFTGPALPATTTVPSTATVIMTEPVTAAVTTTGTTSVTATGTTSATTPISATANSTITLVSVQKGPKQYGFNVLATYPHDPTAYTEGLQYIDGELFESTGLYGNSTLRRVALESGKVEQQINLEDQYFGEGIYVLDDHIYQLTWQSHIAFLYDRKSFDTLDTYSYPTEGWALTYDGKDLLMSDGSSIIYRRDPQTFEERGRIEVHDGTDPVMLLNELEYINGSIWANVWQTNDIVIIDPTNGLVTGRIDLTGLLPKEQAANAEVLNGIAYDEKNDRIFVTGKFWPSLFQIELVPR